MNVNIKAGYNYIRCSGILLMGFYAFGAEYQINTHATDLGVGNKLFIIASGTVQSGQPRPTLSVITKGVGGRVEFDKATFSSSGNIQSGSTAEVTSVGRTTKGKVASSSFPVPHLNMTTCVYESVMGYCEAASTNVNFPPENIAEGCDASAPPGCITYGAKQQTLANGSYPNPSGGDILTLNSWCGSDIDNIPLNYTLWHWFTYHQKDSEYQATCVSPVLSYIGRTSTDLIKGCKSTQVGGEVICTVVTYYPTTRTIVHGSSSSGPIKALSQNK